MDVDCALEPRTQRELALQDLQCSCTQHEAPVLAGLRGSFIDAGNTGLVDAQRTARGVEIIEHQRDLFRWTQPGEEPKLVVVALRFSPIAMDCGDQCLRLLDPEWIDDRSIFLLDARTREAQRWIVLARIVAIAELECPSQDADRVVVRLLAPLRIVSKRNER